MLDYLNGYLDNDDFEIIKKQFNKDILNNFEAMKDNVLLILNYLLSIGIRNIKSIILKRPDLFFEDLELLKEKVGKYDNNLIKFIFDNDPSSLINLEI